MPFYAGSRYVKKQGYTQQSLADAVGMHVNQIKKYEAGTAQPTLSALIKLAQTLHISLDALVFEEGERGPDEELRLQFEMELADLLEVQPRLIGRWVQGKGKPQFDYIIKLADVLEVSLDRVLLGAEKQQSAQFDIQNRKLKELCGQVDQLKPEDQDVICHFLDMAVRHYRLRYIVADSISTVR